MSSILALVLDDGYTSADTADQLALAVVTVYHAFAYYHGHPKQVRDLCQERCEPEAVFDHAALKPPTRHSDVFCTDEHVPSVFITPLRSNEYDVIRVTDVLAREPTTQLLRYCGEEDPILITHDKNSSAAVSVRRFQTPASSSIPIRPS